jgi:hypothetical protein
MTQTLENAVNLPEEQRFFRHGLSWEQFKTIQASFENIPGVRLFYCEGILEIVSIGKPHEAIKCLGTRVKIKYQLDNLYQSQIKHSPKLYWYIIKPLVP